MSGLAAFHGTSDHTIDSKNRTFVPKRFHERLSTGVLDQMAAVLTPGAGGCVYLFSIAGFEAYETWLEAQPDSEEKTRATRLFFPNTYPLSLDGSKRILIPEPLQQLAGLSKEITIVGVGERAEIWDKDAWRKDQAKNKEAFQALAKGLGDGNSPPGVE